MKLSKSRKLHKKKEVINKNPIKEDEVKETIQWYDKQIQENPSDTGLYYAKAALLAREGKYEESIITLDRIIELDRDNEKVWYIKANTLFELGSYEKALHCYDKILEFTWDDERVWYHKGEALSKLGHLKEAIECYDKAIKLDRNYTEAWLGRGNAIRKLHSDNLEDDPKNFDEDRKNELEDALSSYKQVTDLEPHSVQAWNGKGVVLYKLGRYNEALPCYDKCIEIYPDYVSGWYGRGKTLQKLNREEEAVNSFQSAIGFPLSDYGVKDPENLSARAYSFYELGRYEESLECFDKILEKYHDNQYALEGKGTMLEKLGRKKEAIQCYKDAIKLNSKTISNWYQMGKMLSNAGDFDAAIDCYNKAIKQDPECEEAWYRLGELLRRQGNLKKAEECYSSILKINPKNLKVKNALLNLTTTKKSIDAEIQNQNKKDQKKIRKTKLRKKKKRQEKRIFKLIPKYFVNKELRDPSIRSIIKDDYSDQTRAQKGIYIEEDRFDPLYNSSLDCKVDADNDKMLQNVDQKSQYDEIFDNLDKLEKLLEQEMTKFDFKKYKKKQLDIEEDNVEKLIIMGRMFLSRKEFDKALNYFEQALILDPQNLDAWVAKGDVFLELGKIGNASSSYKIKAVSSQKSAEEESNIEMPIQIKTEDDWKNEFITILEDLYSEFETVKVPDFDCPNCGNKVNLKEKCCHGCNAIFKEEKFKTIPPT